MAGRGAVLVVDDDEAILDLVRMTLEIEEYKVVLARHGGEALGLLASAVPGLILLDMQMPVVDGWAFAKAYRRSSDVWAPIVVMSAGKSVAEVARQLGANGYIAKPFDLEELTALVGKHIRNGSI